MCTKYGFLLFAVVCCIPVSLQQSADQQCPRAPGWTKVRNSCYFTGERFRRQTFYSASAFCLSLGAHLVEINDMEEYRYVMSAAKVAGWWDGPWIGMIRLFGDQRWVLPSQRKESNDTELNKMIEGIARGSTHDCAGIDKKGKNIGFWECLRTDGSPWCEIDL